MAEVNIRINDQDYKIACDDGQEQHLASLASYLDSKIRELITRVGQVGESRLLVMACLLITDELLESKKANLEQEKMNKKLGYKEQFSDWRQELEEKCWPGYEKKGMKTMFGKRYPNCVKKSKKKK